MTKEQLNSDYIIPVKNAICSILENKKLDQTDSIFVLDSLSRILKASDVEEFYTELNNLTTLQLKVLKKHSLTELITECKIKIKEFLALNKEEHV